MATSNSSGDENAFELTSPGQRTGEGAGSVLPYLHDSLATKPGELFPADPTPKPAKSLAGRVRKALFGPKKPKKKREPR
jgi:hypothetical protein